MCRIVFFVCFFYKSSTLLWPPSLSSSLSVCFFLPPPSAAPACISCLVMNMSFFTHTSSTRGQTDPMHCILIWNHPQGRTRKRSTRQWTTYLYCASSTSLFHPQCHGNYLNAQFKMITPIIEGNTRRVCLIDNKGAVWVMPWGGCDSSLNGGWMVGLRHCHLKHILPETAHWAINHRNYTIKAERFELLKYTIP